MSSRLLVGLFFGAALWSAQTLRANDELQNAREAWRSIEETGTTGTVVTKSESHNKEGVRTSTVYRNKDLFALITEVPNGEGPSEVVLRNDRGVYGLRRAAGEEQWQLGISEELNSERSKLVFRVGPASAQLVDAIRLHGTTLYRMAQSDYATFSNWEQFLDDRGNQLIRFHVSVDRDDLEKRIAAGEYDFVVDPTHRFRVVSTRAKFPGGITYSDERKYTKDFPNENPTEVEWEQYNPARNVRTKWTVTTVSYTNEPPDPEVFELSYYGIEDVEFASEPSYWWLYALCGVVAAVCLSGYIVMRRRRD